MRKNTENFRQYTRRVDVQVSILLAALVVCACVCLFIFHYNITYGSMIESLSSRTEAVYQYLEKNMNKDSFDKINEKKDMDSELYRSVKNLLEEIRGTASIRYLYTAKKEKDGSYIYMVDGLSSDSKDFRYPGDKIEKENIPDIKNACSGEIVRPDEILKTSWGKIFLAYYPIHDEKTGKVIGVVGMEFDAEQQYDTYRNLKIITPIIIIFMCIAAMLIAGKLFRRISNPQKQDLYNTDQLTQLKSRNAFEFDLNNLTASGHMQGTGIIVMDLDYLKRVNDSYGHAAGDLYIKKTAEAIRISLTGDSWAYRIGGDEFVVVMPNSTESKFQDWISDFQHHFSQLLNNEIPEARVSIGKAVFNAETDQDIYDTYKRADADMYHNKHQSRK